MAVEHTFLNLNRPEYPRNPETLQSALAWFLAKRTEAESGTPRKVGLVYEVITKKQRKTIDIRETRPPDDAFADLLEKAGLEYGGDEGGMERLASCILDGLRGVSGEKANARAAVPLVPGAALLQDAVGLHAKAGPPDFGTIIGQVYALGSVDRVPLDRAARLWHAALSREEPKGLHVALGKALELMGLPGEYDPDAKPRGSCSMPVWLSGCQTPFTWFRKAWDTFCGNGWREALPRRRWCDWASWALRTGIAFAYLWEARFYSRLGQCLINPGKDSAAAARRILSTAEPLLRWRPSREKVGERSVSETLKSDISDGQAVRERLVDQIEEWVEHGKLDEALLADMHTSPTGLADFVARAQRLMNQSSRAELLSCFGGDLKPSAKNTLETVRYLLLCRQVHGEDADFYGLLARHGRRWAVVEPGPEWIVVFASLSAKQPGGWANLRQLKDSLKELGLSPSRETVVQELERAGLSRSSHDADDGIDVAAGF